MDIPDISNHTKTMKAWYLLCVLLSVAGCHREADPQAFYDYTDSFKEHEVTLRMQVKHVSVRDDGTGLAWFRHERPTFQLKTWFPANVKSPPKPQEGDEVRVTFICNRGELEEGNTLIEIERVR